MSQFLAAVVAKQRGDQVLAAIKAADIYDDRRRICEHDDGTLAIPVTEPPTDIDCRVIEQTDPDRRVRDIADFLKERGWDETEREQAPQSWAVIGDVILVRVPDECPDATELGEALLELHGNAETVLSRGGVDGPTRRPERQVIAGTGQTETIHDEHGIRYAMDLSSVMFSPGNKHERARMAALVAADGPEPAATVDTDTIPDQIPALSGTSTERVFDMFAGIGYFTLPMAVAGGDITAAEVNTTSFRYLVENARLNGVGEQITPVLGDNREVTLDEPVDRVVMGHYEATEYLPRALAAVRPGGVIHVHDVTPPDTWDKTEGAIETAVAETDLTYSVADRRQVKTYAEGLDHVVVDVRVE